jgi:hypothetical protein
MPDNPAVPSRESPTPGVPVPESPTQGSEICDRCASDRLIWRNCKLLCTNCRSIVKSCADL